MHRSTGQSSSNNSGGGGGGGSGSGGTFEKNFGVSKQTLLHGSYADYIKEYTARSSRTGQVRDIHSVQVQCTMSCIMFTLYQKSIFVCTIIIILCTCTCCLYMFFFCFVTNLYYASCHKSKNFPSTCIATNEHITDCISISEGFVSSCFSPGLSNCYSGEHLFHCVH